MRSKKESNQPKKQRVATKLKNISSQKDSSETDIRKRVKKQTLSKISKPQDIRPIIRVKKLTKNYGQTRAVKAISFEVKKGEIFGILGPNGAGKTTTLEMLETITQKTSGEIFVDGLDIDIYSQQIKGIIGVQLQEGGFLPRINLEETLNFFADIFGVSIDSEHILKHVNLFEKRKLFVKQLSGGQRQRFSVATTLIAKPKVIFLDEPTTGLDPQARRNLWNVILDLKKTGLTIVLTTHYMDEAEVLCDRIAIMDNGSILEINTTDGFIQKLLDSGFTKPKPTRDATLEDVFLELTGKTIRD